MKNSNGIIIYIKKIKERDLFIKVISKNDEIISGIVYGGNTSKKKLIFQIGYFIEYNLFEKNINKPKYFNADLSKPFIDNILHDKFKLYGLLAIISLTNLSIMEGQRIFGIYKSLKNVIKVMTTQKHWLSYFCEWLFILLEIIGYQIDYKNKKEIKYYDLTNGLFVHSKINNSVLFPYKLLNHQKINFEEVKSIFDIFESIYSKNHLDNINYKMPIQFYNFKSTILNELR